MFAAIRARLKDKVSSLRSKKFQFAPRSLTHYALNNDGPRNHSRFPFTQVMAARAEMPDAHARPAG
jgi:hypothetical protein